MEKIVVIGGGISGFAAAIEAKTNDNEVIILEKENSPLKKLLITGNGKCNYFNEDFTTNHYHSNNKSFIENTITEENKTKVLNFFTSIGIIPEIKNGYYYPYSNQAITIKNALLKEAKIKGIEILLNNPVTKITKQNDKFIVKTKEKIIEANKVIISAGSKAYPKTGSDGSGYTLCEQFNHTIIKVLPALVQLKGEGSYFKTLSGIRSKVKASLLENDKIIKEEVGEVQFTNFGLSGICIFNLSGLASKGLYEKKQIKIKLNFLYNLGLTKEEEFLELLKHQEKLLKKRTISDILDSLLNYKLTNYILKKLNINNDTLLENLSNSKRQAIAKELLEFTINIAGTNSFENAQTCEGGVSTLELNNKTLESNIVKGLYFTGEIIDIYGDCGGYNIGFAILSAILVGESIRGNHD